MCGSCEGSLGSLVSHVDLHALKHLKRCAAVLAFDDERSAARFALVLHHSADPDRPVELLAQLEHPVLAVLGLRHLHAELLEQEFLDVVAEALHLVSHVAVVVCGGVARKSRLDVDGVDVVLASGGIQLMEIAENLVAKLYCLAEQHLLVFGSRRQEPFNGHIVDVLDGNDLFLEVVEVVDEGSVAGRAEEQTVVLGAERTVLDVNGDGVGSLVLVGECNVVFHPVSGLILGLHGGNGLLEESLVLRRNGHAEIGGAVLVAHIGLGLNEMLGKSRADFPVRIFVELQNAFWLSSVVKSFSSKEFAQS